MGSGTWDSTTYTRNVASAAAAGRSTFDYSDSIRSGRIATKVNELLDPHTKAGDASVFNGTVMRECCVSDEHPNPTAIAIVLDVTGSNYAAAQVVHAKLPLLFGLLQRKGLIEDPQILIAATGDAYCDRVPLQVGQFESDNRIDDMVTAMYLEGGGGGGNHETYELAAYFLANHTHLESVEKQSRKGYAFFIGDERCYDPLKRGFISEYIGTSVQEDVPAADVFSKLAEQYEPFYLFQKQGSYASIIDDQLAFWRQYVGEGALVLEDPNTVCETIAGLLAMREGGLDLDEVAEELEEAGFDKAAILSASKTLATVGGGGGGAIAKVEGDLGEDDSAGTERL